MPSPSGRAREPEVVAAGAVVLDPRRRVLVVHRPRYDDWSFPKGKVDPGEHVLAAAAREVREETGLTVRLGVPLAGQRYPVAAGVKSVRYWLGRPVGDREVRGYRRGDEIDAVRWVDLDRASSALDYERDVATLDQACSLPRKTRTLIVLRHGVAQARRTYRGRDDRRRPLLASGRRQAEGLVPLLGAYGVRRVVTSSSARCEQTVAPYAAWSGRPLERTATLSEEDATPDDVRRLVLRVRSDLLAGPSRRAATVLCSHRPVLPWVMRALGVEDVHLEKGEMLVLHLADGHPVACERHLPV